MWKNRRTKIIVKFRFLTLFTFCITASFASRSSISVLENIEITIQFSCNTIINNNTILVFSRVLKLSLWMELIVITGNIYLIANIFSFILVNDIYRYYKNHNNSYLVASKGLSLKVYLSNLGDFPSIFVLGKSFKSIGSRFLALIAKFILK